jgi:molybdopterin converting factor small subunit
MVEIEVVVFATLRQYLPDLKLGGTKPLKVESGTTLAQVIDILGLPPQDVKVVMRNHLQARLDDVVQDGDRVGFFPPVAGG